MIQLCRGNSVMLEMIKTLFGFNQRKVDIKICFSDFDLEFLPLTGWCLHTNCNMSIIK